MSGVVGRRALERRPGGPERPGDRAEHVIGLCEQVRVEAKDAPALLGSIVQLLQVGGRAVAAHGHRLRLSRARVSLPANEATSTVDLDSNPEVRPSVVDPPPAAVSLAEGVLELVRREPGALKPDPDADLVAATLQLRLSARHRISDCPQAAPLP